MMDMLDAGLFEVLVVDDWKARMWAQVLPKLKVRNDLILRKDARTGWAIRKDSPKLAAEVPNRALIPTLEVPRRRLKTCHQAGNSPLMLSQLWIRRMASAKSGATETTSTLGDRATG
jgi:hypothetical protein